MKTMGRVVDIHVDMDGLAVIMRDCSRYDFSARPDYVFHSGAEKILDLFEKFHIKATLFVVGKDLLDNAKRATLRSAQRLGHDFGNHTYSHPRWFNRLPVSQKREEITHSHRLIEDHLGVSPKGFRAPGFSISSDVLPILVELGYLYDSSVLPSPYGSLVSWALHRAGGSDDLGLMREPLSLRRALCRNRPYRPSFTDVYRAGDAPLWELPVTCIPFLRFPFHASYVLNSSLWLFRLGEWALKLSGNPLNYLFHLKDASLDLESADLAGAAFNPISSKRRPERIWLLERILERLSRGKVCLASAYVNKLMANEQQN